MFSLVWESFWKMSNYNCRYKKRTRQWLTLSWRRPLPYRNQSIDLLCKSMDWFLYDIGFRHERVKDSDSKGKSSRWESSMKPGKLYMNTNSILINKKMYEYRTYNHIMSEQVYISLKPWKKTKLITWNKQNMSWNFVNAHCTKNEVFS